METANVGLKSSRLQWSYTAELQQRLSSASLWSEEHNGVGGCNNIKFEAWEADLFVQSVQIRR